MCMSSEQKVNEKHSKHNLNQGASDCTDHDFRMCLEIALRAPAYVPCAEVLIASPRLAFSVAFLNLPVAGDCYVLW